MTKYFKGKFPDLTPAQLVAFFFGALNPVLTLIGVDLSPVAHDALDQLKYLALGLFGADAAIRVGRNLGNKKDDTATFDEDPEVDAAHEEIDREELPVGV